MEVEQFTTFKKVCFSNLKNQTRMQNHFYLKETKDEVKTKSFKEYSLFREIQFLHRFQSKAKRKYTKSYTTCL